MITSCKRHTVSDSCKIKQKTVFETGNKYLLSDSAKTLIDCKFDNQDRKRNMTRIYKITNACLDLVCAYTRGNSLFCFPFLNTRKLEKRVRNFEVQAERRNYLLTSRISQMSLPPKAFAVCAKSRRNVLITKHQRLQLRKMPKV